MKTPYMDKCLCGHVRESHTPIGPWEYVCHCGCEAFGSRYELTWEENEDEEDGGVK